MTTTHNIDLFSTISARSTPPGRGGIGIVRFSGPDALGIALKVFRFGPELATRETVAPGALHFGWVIAGEEKIDDGYLVFLEAPNSFTGENVVELQLHGSPRGLERVVKLCLAQGENVRLAEPGEFSKRAFLHGKIDLTEAEAIIDLIDARTTRSAELASRQLSGALGEKIRAVRIQLTYHLAHVEAMIDFPEDQVPEINETEFDQVMAESKAEIDTLLKRSEHAWVYRDGLRVAIVGAPNMGKSSLFNALLARDRAIVSPISGTTRDVLEEGVDIEGVPVIFSDTAGITETEDVIERMGIERSLRAIEESALVVLVVVAGTSDNAVRRFLRTVKPIVRTAIEAKPKVTVYNKIDQVEDETARREEESVWLSVKADQGLDLLKAMIVERYLLQDGEGDTLVVTNLRQQQSLRAAQQAITQVIDNRERALGWDVVAHELRDGVEALGKITGESVDAELHDQIFSRFCIGK